ncbi:MAG: class II aldolase/adducin family protein [Austwickia sp.]|jgi:L-fuculose-phosphate aldolase|nr:MAG: class II aldolase/adducin family protein [Austwickia sp.]
MMLQDARELITATCARLGPDGLIVGTAGNLSIREGELLAITPSGLPYEDLRPDLVAVVDLATGEQVDGPLRPASELDLHLATLRATGQAAVVHTHSPAATAVASLVGVTALPAVHYYIALFGGPDVRVADYATYGSAELAANVERALTGPPPRRAALMANHGSVVAGPDLATAYTLALELEWLCELYLRTRAAGEPRILPDGAIAEVAAKIAGYGQRAPGPKAT